jgi:hypothetical protein
LLTVPGMKVTTTLDAGIQRTAIQALRHQLEGLGAHRARDGAVVVVDNASGEVLAYVGGVGLGSTAAMVDGADARRQAGSTLKPHLYAQLIEGRWMTAASILDDSRCSWTRHRASMCHAITTISSWGRCRPGAPWPIHSMCRRCAPCCWRACSHSATVWLIWAMMIWRLTGRSMAFRWRWARRK